MNSTNHQSTQSSNVYEHKNNPDNHMKIQNPHKENVNNLGNHMKIQKSHKESANNLGNHMKIQKSHKENVNKLVNNLRQSYENPEIAQRKRQQARQQSRKSYENPEIAQTKRQQALQQTKYIIRKFRNSKNKTSTSSSINLGNHTKIQKSHKENAHNLGNHMKIHKKQKRKRQQTQAHRTEEHSDINTIISDFQKSCKEDQLIYICQICQRIFFKKQFVALYANNYNRAILTKSLPSHVNINALPTNEKKKKKKKQKEKENQNTNESWLCYTCHQNLLSKSCP